SSAAANRAVYLAIGVGATMITGALSYLYYKYMKQDVMPLKWRRVGTLQQINLFPIKSCAPLELNPEEELLCEVLGLRYRGIRDRVLMVVNDNYEMITARVYPRLVLIHTRVIGESKLIITAEGMEPLELDFSTLADEAPCQDIHTSVFGSKVDAMLCDNGLRLVYYPYPKPVRAINSDMAKLPFIQNADTGTFGDATSYMLMNLSSVEDLNTRLERPVDPLQFRGNFNLKMDIGEAYAEDNWQWIRIGEEAVFRNVAPCTRCIFPNINVKTAERDPDGQPLKKLKSYRLIHDKSSPTLGIHMGVRQTGAIKLNDVIYIEDNSEK
ncbi:hypothetical protein DOY81_009945, partial [Sarcophaga bullata]